MKVCCEGSGSHYRDATDKPFCQDTSTMLAKTAQGRLIKIRVDLPNPQVAMSKALLVSPARRCSG